MLDYHFNSPNEPENWVAALHRENSWKNKAAFLGTSLDATCLEYVHFILFDNSAAYLVEHGHHEEGVENESVHFDFLFVHWIGCNQVVVISEHKRSEEDK